MPRSRLLIVLGFVGKGQTLSAGRFNKRMRLGWKGADPFSDKAKCVVSEYDMQEKLTDISSLNFRRIFPWVQLLRTFGIAVDIRKVCLAAAGLMMLTLGNRAILYLPFAPDETIPFPWEVEFGYSDSDTNSRDLSGSGNALKLSGEILQQPIETLPRIFTNWTLILRPVNDLIEPAVVLFQTNRGDNGWSEIAYAWARLLWALCVWSIFGGAICRMVAVQFARDERIGIRSALAFSGKRFFSYLSAPLLPLAGIGALWLICLAGGLIGRIPVVGEFVVSVGFMLPLLFGFFMTLMLIGVAAGWPLMFATISTEGSDGFDGLSRSYSYIYDRPWYYAWLLVLTMVYSSVAIFFVWFATSLTVHLAGWSITTGMGEENTSAILHSIPPLLDVTPLGDTSTHVSLGASAIVGYWLYAVALLLVGFVYSFFWTSATVIYFLLRLSDDAIELDEVYLPPEPSRDELLAMVTEDDSGTAAAPDAPETEETVAEVEPRESDSQSVESDNAGDAESAKDEADGT